jgi:hypothetical protein
MMPSFATPRQTAPPPAISSISHRAVDRARREAAEPVDADTRVLSTGGASLYERAAFLSSLEIGFPVLDPAELHDSLRRLGDRFTAAARAAHRSRRKAATLPARRR